ncbi:Pc17g00330 [Rhizoctonia solani AG-1 IB]|nr:Pc17g00330 [Rhizoctonia solani AG-1 IB]
MKVMVTLNVETDLDIANGARGTITGIALDPNEPAFENPLAPVVTLSRLPAYILVKLDRTRAAPVAGLGEGVIPLIPASKSYYISLSVVQEDGKTKEVRQCVNRLQFPITPAYAFTNYRSQGQMIPAAIVDIATPPSGNGLNLANLYAALSRCTGKDNIQILQDFDESMFSKSWDYELVKENKRLERLDKETEDKYTTWEGRISKT